MPSNVSCRSLYMFTAVCWASALWYLSISHPSTSYAGHLSIRKMAKLDKNVTEFHPHKFAFLINEPTKCKSAEPPFLVILVSTAHNEFDARRAIRETWGDGSALADVRVVTVFLLGRSADPVLQQAVEKESQVFHDMLVADYIDSYHNLTLKTLTAMHWVATFCPGAWYVLKTDSDVFVNTENLVFDLLMPAAKPRRRYFTGHVINMAPIRDMHSKWYMPRDMYPNIRYPPFCSGTGYVFSADVAALVYEASLSTRLLHLEDVYVGLCLHKLGIHPFQHTGFNHRKVAYSLCLYRQVVTVHQVSPEEMHHIWNDMSSKKHVKC